MSAGLAAVDEIMGTGQYAGLKDEDLSANDTRWLSAADLLNSEDPESEYLVDGLLILGGTSLLAAAPKVGKSIFAQNLSVAVCHGEPFLGLETRQGTVMYAALEEKQSELKAHMQALGLRHTDPFHYKVGSAPQDALEWLTEGVDQYKPMLIIVDTFQRLCRVRDLNDYAKVTNALEPIVDLARECDAHLLMTHHARKSGGEYGDAVLGSQALFASVDTLVELRRTDNCRFVSSIQRYGEDMPETVVEMNPETFRLSLNGTRQEADTRAVCEGILLYLGGLEPDEQVEREQIEKSVGGRPGPLRKALNELVSAGDIQRLGEGKKGDPYRYCVPCSQSDVETGTGNKKPNNVIPLRQEEEEACSPKHAPEETRDRESPKCSYCGRWRVSLPNNAYRACECRAS